MIKTILIFVTLIFAAPAFADRQGGGVWMQIASKPTAVYYAGTTNDNRIVLDFANNIGNVKRYSIKAHQIDESVLTALEKSSISKEWVQLK